MIANFTSETCTGTGDTLTLTGALPKLLPFNKSFEDGALVLYVVKDEDGVTKAAGVATFNTGPDRLLRDDSYNVSSGGVVDNNPSTNIALSGGTHIVSCELINSSIVSMSQNARCDGTMLMNGLLNSSAGATSATQPVDQQRGYIFRLMESAVVAHLELVIMTADGAGSASIGLSRCIAGISDTAYIASGTIDLTTTGAKTIPVNQFLVAGYYFCHLVTDSATAAFNGTANYGNRISGWTPLKKTTYANRNSPCLSLSKAAVLSGVLDVAPETVTSNSHATTNDVALLFTMTRA